MMKTTSHDTLRMLIVQVCQAHCIWQTGHCSSSWPGACLLWLFACRAELLPNGHRCPCCHWLLVQHISCSSLPRGFCGSLL